MTITEKPTRWVAREAAIFEGDLLFIEWSAVSEKTRVEDGIDTFVSATASFARRPFATPCSQHSAGAR